ncbi:MAG: (d)CMP kinase [Casimicrobiaceae bacterium]
MSARSPVPVLAVDGPTASGKGTVCRLLARRLGFHLLDSGAIYRAFALAVISRSLEDREINILQEEAQALSLEFRGDRVWLDGQDATEAIRAEAVGLRASRLSALPEVRLALLARQRAFAMPPGLVADGRDMGTVVFPEAQLKVFLTATTTVRAARRAAQQPGEDPCAIAQAIRARDQQDRERTVAPLRPAADAIVLDNAGHTPERTVEAVLALWRERMRA